MSICDNNDLQLQSDFFKPTFLSPCGDLLQLLESFLFVFMNILPLLPLHYLQCTYTFCGSIISSINLFFCNWEVKRCGIRTFRIRIPEEGTQTYEDPKNGEMRKSR